MIEEKESSISSDGDRWSLEVLDGDMTVIHKANEPSGGHETLTPLPVFLGERAGKPEHAALLQVLGQSRDEIEDQLQTHETETQSLKIATEYLRLGGRRQAKGGRQHCQHPTLGRCPSEADAYWQTHVAPLTEKEQRDIMIHLPSMSDR
ncbi:hypothetical protein [Rhizobium sp. P38BS-XIX]|uniref:hypothetical protein n=1 Tax=Rhizobium sp. P38BS-XIX TaxID=2726740 RepID=UPI001FED3B1C|nr:hypothetical protein [Rhizobium sp. P38BS-XIX]